MSLKKPASAFAPAQGGSGKTIAWESIANDPVPEALNIAFPNVADVVAGQTLRFRTLLPENVTRGTVTLERIRGWVNTYTLGTIIDTAGQRANIPIPMNIQLAPIQNGVIIGGAVLDPSNAADNESNRIIWRQTYVPNLNTPDGTAYDGVRAFQNDYASSVIDIKSRRRFDRATWALIMTVVFDTVVEVDVDASVDLRALFRTGDGV